MARRRGARHALALTAAALWIGACGDDSSAEKIRAAKLSEGCLLDSDCNGELICVFQRCHVQCNTSEDCEREVAPGVRCMLGSKPANVCQLFTDCEYDSQCEGNQVCGADNQCRDQCRADRDCVQEQVCVTGVCANQSEVDNGQLKGVDRPGAEGEPCRYHSDCDGALLCRDGECAVECRTAKDCPLGWTCADGRCDPPGGNGGAGGGGGAGGTSGAGGSGGSAPGHCFNRIVDGDETGEDCGGSCMPCGPGFSCADGTDCSSGVCAAGRCASPSCYDGSRNGDETDVDCGGPCGACATGATCQAPTDCASLACDDALNVCIDATCTDSEQNGTETGVDCGGPTCPSCAIGQGCVTDSDCEGTALCGGSTCAESFELRVTLAGTGPGSVVDDRGRLNCPALNCTARYPSGVTVNLAATPASGGTFTRWDGACTGANPASCAILMDQDRSVLPSFAGGAAAEWLTNLAGSQLSIAHTGDTVLQAGGSFVASGDAAGGSAAPCGTTLTGGQWLARYDASGACTSGLGTRVLAGTTATLGLGLNASSDVFGAFRFSGPADLGQGVLLCDGFVVAAFDPTTLGTKWNSACLTANVPNDATSRPIGDLAVVGAVATGDDPGGGPVTTTTAIEGFVGVYSGAAGALSDAFQLNTESEFKAVAADGNNGLVVGGYCHGLWDSSTQSWIDQSATYSLCVVRLDSALNVTWIRSWSTSWNNSDRPGITGLALGTGVAGSEDVYWIGRFYGSVNDATGGGTARGQSDLAFGQLDGATGTSVWFHTAGSALTENHGRIALDGNGDVTIAGVTRGDLLLHNGATINVAPAQSPFIVEMTPAGVVKQTTVYLGAPGNNPGVAMLKTWTGGSLLMMGHVFRSADPVDFGSVGKNNGTFLLKLAP